MILFFYVLREFFRYVGATLLLCTFLFVLFDFIHKTTKYIGVYNPSTINLLKLYWYQSPSLIVQALPMASLLASVITMVLLSRTNEVTAMRAAGLGPLRIGMPIAVGGLILCIFSVLIGEFLLPKSSKKKHFIESVLIKQKSDDQFMEGARWLRDGSSLYHLGDYEPSQNLVLNIHIIQTGNSFRPKRTIRANSAKYNEQTKNWKLKDAKVLYFWPNGTIAFQEEKNELVLPIPIEPEKLKKDNRLPNERGIAELMELVSQGNASGTDVLGLKVDMHTKMAFHLSSFVVCLIGLKFGYRSERSMETARGILLALAIGVGYWIILNSGRALANSGSIPPLVGAWMGNMVIFLISCFSIWRTKHN